jgi:hypothetical protein
MNRPIILLLDIDGVCHDFGAYSKDYFCYLPRLESVLRAFPEVLVVISSDWRKEDTLGELRTHFSPDIQPRVIGVTPCFSFQSYGEGIRFHEGQTYLRQNNLDEDRWLALDDVPENFATAPGHIDPRLVICDDGFREREETLLTEKLLLLGEGSKS